MKKLPIGIQSIQDILSGGYVYVDKTHFAQELIQNGKHYFISRPRRFGKSLFVDTLAEILKGNKELFKDCYIGRSDYDWQPYPILNFNFARLARQDPTVLEGNLKRKMAALAEAHQCTIQTFTIQEALEALITSLASDSKVAVLIDEYDYPIISNLDHLEVANQNRELLKGFFTTLKNLDNYLKLTFVTGISKFSQVSLFSGANHLQDLTMHPSYAKAMGYTQEELKHNFAAHIHAIAAERKVPEEEVLAEIKQWYNGYRFSEEKTYVYNPFSTLNYMNLKKPKGYWYTSGTPSFIVKELKKYPAENFPLEDVSASEENLMEKSTIEEMDVNSLMFQTGYLTVRDYDELGQQYTLGFPNQEVRQAFVHSLAKQYVPQTASLATTCRKALAAHQIEPFFEALQGTISSFPYWLFSREQESTYHMMLLSLLRGMDFSVAAEVATHQGRIDLLLQTKTTTFVIEVKLDSTAEAALQQIHDKQYFRPYLHQGRQIVLLGLNFSTEARNMTEWLGELRDEAGKLVQPLAKG